MKTLAILLVLFPVLLIAQPTIDGDISDADYITAATKLNANASFGTQDVSKIVYYADVSNSMLYIGVEAVFDNTAANSIGLWLGLNQETGVSAGSSLGGSPGSDYMDSPGHNDFMADFEVDYMFALNPNSTTECNVYAVKLIGTREASTLGDCGQSGSSITGPSGSSDFWTQNSVTFAFDNSGTSDKGFEIKIPFSELGSSVTKFGQIKFFAFVTADNAYFSNVTVPGDISGSDIGYDPDFGSLSTGPFNSGNVALPVELTSFTAIPNENSIQLSWQTATETNNQGFNIERKTDDGNWTNIGFVAGAGNTNSPQNYSFTDQPTGGINFSYRLKQIDNDGKFKYYDEITVTLSFKQTTELMQNSPNPFNPSTSIKYYIPQKEDVTITIYDMLGREVNTLINKQTAAGYHIVFWNGKDLYGNNAASGVYLYRLKAGNFIQTKKMALLK